MLDKAASSTEEQIAEIQRLNTLRVREGEHLLYGYQHATPYLDTRLDALALFDQATQQKLLDIGAQLKMLNSQVEQANHWADLTLASGLSDQQQGTINANLESAYRLIRDRARALAGRIESLELE